jgi:hypothetical protein
MPQYTVELTGLMASPGGGFILRVYTQFERLANGLRQIHSTKCVVVFKDSVYKQYPNMDLAAFNAELDRLDDEETMDTAWSVNCKWDPLANFDSWGLSQSLGKFDAVVATWAAVTPAEPPSPGL